MFSKAKAPNPHAGNTTLIAAGTTVTGNLSFSGNVEVEGKVVGDLVAADPGHGTVRVLAAGVVEGEIRAPTVIVNGTVNGDVHASEHVELAAKATVTGNVHYKLIEMVKGAQVNGNLVYAGAEADAPAAAKRPAETPVRDGDAAVPNT